MTKELGFGLRVWVFGAGEVGDLGIGGWHCFFWNASRVLPRLRANMNMPVPSVPNLIQIYLKCVYHSHYTCCTA